jgi:hypothetical protein
MTKFDWKILQISADGDLITHAKYHVTAIDDQENKVETEGNWWFDGMEISKPFNEVNEADVIEWIEKETTKFGNNIIKSRLEEQLASLNGNRIVVAPWLPQTFTPNI